MIEQRPEDSFPDTDIYASVWLVRCGSRTVGPVSLELIARGLDAGRIPHDAEMCHLDDLVWRPVATFGPMPDPFGAADRLGQTTSAEPCIEPAPDTIPDAAPSLRYPEEPISIPMLGVVGSLFG